MSTRSIARTSRRWPRLTYLRFRGRLFACLLEPHSLPLPPYPPLLGLPPSPRPRPPLPLPSLPPPPRPRPPLRSPLPSRWAAPSARSAKLLWRQPPPLKPSKCGAVSRLYGPTSTATAATCDAGRKCGAVSRLYGPTSAATPATTCDTGGGSPVLLAAYTTGRLSRRHPHQKKINRPLNPRGWRGCVSLSLCVPVACGWVVLLARNKELEYFRRALVRDSFWVRFPAAF